MQQLMIAATRILAERTAEAKAEATHIEQQIEAARERARTIRFSNLFARESAAWQSRLHTEKLAREQADRECERLNAELTALRQRLVEARRPIFHSATIYTPWPTFR
jgi:SMC interacting uncharacterized protein involved in chromosome segregation